MRMCERSEQIFILLLIFSNSFWYVKFISTGRGPRKSIDTSNQACFGKARLFMGFGTVNRVQPMHASQASLISFKGTAIRQDCSIEIFTDASLSGWGAACNGNSLHGSWSRKELEHHILIIWNFWRHIDKNRQYNRDFLYKQDG